MGADGRGGRVLAEVHAGGAGRPREQLHGGDRIDLRAAGREEAALQLPGAAREDALALRRGQELGREAEAAAEGEDLGGSEGLGRRDD